MCSVLVLICYIRGGQGGGYYHRGSGNYRGQGKRGRRGGQDGTGPAEQPQRQATTAEEEQ